MVSRTPYDNSIEILRCYLLFSNCVEAGAGKTVLAYGDPRAELRYTCVLIRGFLGQLS